MSFDAKTLRRAEEELSRRRESRKARLSDRRQAVALRVPEIRQLEGQLLSTMARLVPLVGKSGDDGQSALMALRDENLELQRQIRALLIENGYPEDYLDDSPDCPECDDRGYVGASICPCLTRLCGEMQKKELEKTLSLKSFDDFSLDWYSAKPDPAYGVSPRESMEIAYDICLDYARKFSRGNLFFNGGTGLGKTMLSGCIALEVSARGYSVRYLPASGLFSLMEAVKFGSGDKSGAQAELDRAMRCDLLIIDDLGTEMSTAFTVSALYTVINTRLVDKLGTIITSNLSMDELRRRYTPQTVSRIEGEYMLLPFFGDDIRVARKGEKYR